MEAAAARSFLGVSGSILQMCLRDIRAKGLKSRHQDIYTLISAYSNEWGWSEIDVARAMMPVLPGQKSAPAGRKITPSTTTMAPEIARIAALAAALREQECGQQKHISSKVGCGPEGLAEAIPALRSLKMARVRNRGRLRADYNLVSSACIGGVL